MNAAVRRFLVGIPGMDVLYRNARRRYHQRRIVEAARGQFANIADYRHALTVEDGRAVDIRTNDGLTLTIRRNYMDAAILAEVFMDNAYTKHVQLPAHPTIIDIGGYIGDFALFAAHRLKAKKVIVCEPSPRNWALLKRNITNNGFEDRIIAINKAVTDGSDIMMCVDTTDRGQARVSAYYATDVERQMIPGTSLQCIMDENQLDIVDLLKIDCEGGEYTIIGSTPPSVFERIRNIVFEYHEIENFQAKLAAAKEQLSSCGFALRTAGSLIYASRP